MKQFVIGFILFLLSAQSNAQVQIHSHNDYLQKQPLLTAYQNRVAEIEADVFLVGDSLIVAHSKKEIKTENTLGQLYLAPIAKWFKQYQNKVSNTKKYTFKLMIDVKENWAAVYPVLQKQLERYGKVFDRSSNKNAIQIVISGNRPPDSTFHTYPSWLFFDGLPTINYAKNDLQRVTMISDNFVSYSKWNGVGVMPEADQAKLSKVIKEAHQLNKPIRFWGAPDTEACWAQLHQLGADIINTDKITACKTYFEQYN